MAIQIDLFRSMAEENQSARLDKLESSLTDVRRGLFARFNTHEKNLLEIEKSLNDLHKRIECIEMEISMKVKMG